MLIAGGTIHCQPPRNAPKKTARTRHVEDLEPLRILTPATADLRDDEDVVLLVIDEAQEILADDLRRES